MVIDDQLPLGLIANTSAILGITLGKYIPKLAGSSVTDRSGVEHIGIVKTPVPILKGNTELLRQLREKGLHEAFADLIMVDFSDVAQNCKTYQEYITKLQQTSKEDYQYLGLAIYGEKKKINHLTGDLPLLR
nr:DUF2000 domain-containing protein [Gracilibacillus alcaliphilus]